MKEKRGFWFLLTGLAIGLGTGLLVAWVFAPLQYVNTSPASMRIDFKDQYRYMIAAAYTTSGDLARAEARLGTLADPDPVKALGEQAQRMLANHSSLDVVQVLADLSEALQTRGKASPAGLTATGLPSTAVTIDINQASLTPLEPPAAGTLELPATATITNSSVTENPTVLEDTPTPAPSALFTVAPRPVRTATATAGAAFDLTKQSTFCEASQPGLLKIYLTDDASKPAAGIELVISWSGGVEHFFTGFKPEISYGYADFEMTENVEYALSLSAGGTRVTDLLAPSCTDAAGGTYPGGILLEFKQP